MSTWNRNRFSVFTSDEKDVLGLVEELGKQTNDNSDALANKTDLTGDHKGSWQGLSKPTLSEEGLRATVEKIVDEDLPRINSSLETMTNVIHIEQFIGNDDTEKINKAIAKLTNGGTIQLKSKTYTFDNVVIPQNISLIGTTNTIIRPKEDTSKPIIHFTGSNHTLKDIYYDDMGLVCKGIVFGDFGGITGSGKISNIKIENVKVNIRAVQNPGLCIGYCDNVIIKNNKVINVNKATTSNNYSQGICVHSDSPNYCDNVIISENYVKGFYAGIILWGTGVRNNVVINKNVIEDCCHVGIDGYHAGKMNITDNIVNRCYIGIFGDTISIENNMGRGNVISNNQVHRCTLIGIYFEEFSNGVISNNTVQDSEYGIYGGAGLKHTLIIGNTSSFNKCGLYISNEHVPTPMQGYYNQDCVIKGNVFSYNREEGAKLLGLAGGWVIESNDFLSNNVTNGGFYGLYVGDDTFQSPTKTSQVVTISNNNFLNKGLSIGGTLGQQTKGLYIKCGYGFIQSNFVSCTEQMISSYYSKPILISNIFDGSGTFQLSGGDHKAQGNFGLADKLT